MQHAAGGPSLGGTNSLYLFSGSYIKVVLEQLQIQHMLGCTS